MLRVSYRNRQIRIIPGRWDERLLRVIWHFLMRGPILGFNQQLNPNPKPNYYLAAIGLVCLTLAIALTHGLVKLGLFFLLVSPATFYFLSTIPETVIEWRGYILPLGLACLVAALPWTAIALIPLFVFKNFQRQRAYRTPLSWWKQAAIDAPGYARPEVNYAWELFSAGEEQEAARRFEKHWDFAPPFSQFATQTLVMIYLNRRRIEEAEPYIGYKGKAILRWPNSARLRYLRGQMLELQGRNAEAEVAFKMANKLQDIHAK